LSEYQQWWYAQCGSDGGSCGGNCEAASLSVSDSLCGTFSAISAGCVPKSFMSAGYACFIRLSDNEVILTREPPSLSDAFRSCGVVLVGKKPDCSDGPPEDS